LVLFKRETSENTAVITDGEVVDCVTFQHNAESYDLKCAFLMMEESLQMGTITSFAIHPKLLVSCAPGPIQLLKEMLISVVSIDSEGISSEKQFPEPFLPPQA